MVMHETVGCLLVAFLWGITNPLMKRGAAGVETVSDSANQSQLRRVFSELKYLVINWKYTLPFLVNQGGSLLYYWTLSSSTLSAAVPLTNALTLVITVLFGKIFGEQSGGILLYIGITLVFLGTAVANS